MIFVYVYDIKRIMEEVIERESDFVFERQCLPIHLSGFSVICKCFLVPNPLNNQLDFLKISHFILTLRIRVLLSDK